MSHYGEDQRVTLPAHKIGDTVYFSLKGKPVDVLLRIATPDGTVISAPIANYGQIEIFCGADRGDLDIELVVPDGELTTIDVNRVPGPDEGSKL